MPTAKRLLPLITLFAFAATAARAQTVPATPPTSGTVTLEPFITTGTRFNGRLVAESPVPIDLIAREELTAGGYTDLQRMLKARVPAFSLPNSNGAGAVDFVSAPTLR